MKEITREEMERDLARLKETVRHLILENADDIGKRGKEKSEIGLAMREWFIAENFELQRKFEKQIEGLEKILELPISRIVVE